MQISDSTMANLNASQEIKIIIFLKKIMQIRRHIPSTFHRVKRQLKKKKEEADEKEIESEWKWRAN